MNPEELAAQAATQAPAPAPAAPQTVAMVGVDGRVYDATPEQAQAMLQARSSGGAQLFHPETPEEAQARQARIDYGGVGGQVASAAAGFTAGVPGLASTIAQSADLAHELTDACAVSVCYLTGKELWCCIKEGERG